ncbi:agmatine deiminase family protein [Thioalkalivibrio paradoxus]|uniref:Agmatine deiminase n=1 Tax=Thioalkalivibrio paradoxus ARh 1 TaxID=713585 RepID=W0DIH2_9GAMM|nr:agmatine deiminase family protein [Thioalkalivibrio paradoxus]AHE98196.1 agmatine deiminase [Thioalkalivibrio paradoxus ARh 1]
MARRLPAEWELQSGVQLTWPHPGTDWAPRLAAVEPVFAAIGASIARHESLLVVCQDADHRTQVLAQLAHAGADLDRVQLGIAPANDTWARDHGPITVLQDDGPILLDFTFNGWGGKFEATHDNELTRKLAAQGRFGTVPVETVDLVLEGGSIESDGAGTVLTTSRCLLEPNRNPGLWRADLERRLGEHLGATRVLWLEHGGLEGDDTDGHIDTLARFCDPETIAFVVCADRNDPHYRDLAAMAGELEALRQPSGEPYRLLPLPLPAPIVEDGHRYAATYANFLIINEAVLVPVYDDPADDVALETIAAAFPGRSVVGIDCREIIRQGGSLHCLTMQFPQGILPA